MQSHNWKRARSRALSRKNHAIAAPALLAIATVFSSALAQELSCDDIEFKESIIEQFPSVAQSCNSVVERNGKLYVRLVADVIHAGPSSVMLYLKSPDGTRVRQEWMPPPGFQATISGKPTPTRALRRGQEIRIYLPEADWEVVGAPAHE